VTAQLTEQQIAALPTLRVLHHYRIGRVCVFRRNRRGRLLWSFRSELTGRWMPCVNAHPPKYAIHVPIDPPPAGDTVKTVHKHTLDLRVRGSQSLIMSPGEIVGVAMQHDEVRLWAVTDTDADLVARDFVITGTGADAPADGRYVGIVHDPIQAMHLVWHVWETTRRACGCRITEDEPSQQTFVAQAQTCSGCQQATS
jgi:hypothetical protein